MNARGAAVLAAAVFLAAAPRDTGATVGPVHGSARAVRGVGEPVHGSRRPAHGGVRAGAGSVRSLDGSQESGPLVPTDPTVLTTVVHFGFGRARLRQRAEGALEHLADRINGRGPNVSGVRLSLHGHTDAIGSPPYNVGLSARRAFTVARRLQALLHLRHVPPFVAYGERRPAAPNARRAGRARNRRVWVTVVIR
jgi:outer membrane protein OmpA-like peptidoglycan-associated protein